MPQRVSTTVQVLSKSVQDCPLAVRPLQCLLHLSSALWNACLISVTIEMVMMQGWSVVLVNLWKGVEKQQAADYDDGGAGRRLGGRSGQIEKII